jgi:tRNA pseudouridine55 synthase
MYELARAGVSNIEIKPCRVNIYKSELLEFNEKEQWADILVECSKGTYIRSLANDLGKDLNNGCYLSKLKRVKAGGFEVENSVILDDLKNIQDVEKVLINPTDYLTQPKQELNDVEYKRISHGMTIYNRIDATNDKIVMLTKGNNLVAIAQATNDGLKPKKVFIN